MEYNILLIRYGELFLKGKNRPLFERKLVQNIHKIAQIRVHKLQRRLVAPYSPEHQKLQQVFGLVSYSPALRVEKDMIQMKEAAVALLRKGKGTFRVETRRADKSFPLTSPEINREMGLFVEKETPLTFSLTDPDLIMGMEINQDGAYLFVETIACPGGLPTGVEGKTLLLMENEAGLLAGLLFMKRGCRVIPVSLSPQNISLLQKFSPGPMQLHVVKDLKEVEKIASEKNIQILISGQNLKNYKKYDTGLLVMRPLIAYSENKIQERVHKFKN